MKLTPALIELQILQFQINNKDNFYQLIVISNTKLNPIWLLVIIDCDKIRNIGTNNVLLEKKND